MLWLLGLRSVLADCGDDVCRTGQELITSKGFPLQEHFVTTEDGYILRMLRFFNPNVSAPAGAHVPKGVRPAVMLQHGLMDSADTWIVNYRNSSLAFILADLGFDVWLGNTRGNKYSRNHTTFNPNPPDNERFWFFTYDEMAKYDLTAQIDHILKSTGLSNISYIGHSQGTTQVFANLAQPQNITKYSVAKKINVFVALAPVAYIHHCSSFLLQLVSKLRADELIAILQMHEFILSREVLEKLLPGVCKEFPAICDDVLKAIAGYDPSDFDQARWPVYIGHFPTGESTRELEHYAQGIRYEWFNMYNLGLIENLVVYGQDQPPAYKLTSLTPGRSPPIGIFYGKNDDLADVKDVERLLQELPKQTVAIVDYNDHYAHMDYTWGQYAYRDLYPKVINLIKKYF